jgi:hypothetical protein
LAVRLQPFSDTPLLEPVSQHVLLGTVNGSGKTNGHSNGTKSTGGLREEYVAIPENETIASLVRPLVDSVEAAADIEPLIEASVEAVAIAVEGAIETAEAVEQVAVAADTVKVAPAVEIQNAPPVDEMPVATAQAAIETTLTLDVLEATPAVEVPVATLSAAVEALALDILETAPVVALPVATVPAAVEEAPVRATAETASVMETPVAAVSAPVVEAPVIETIPVVEIPLATLSAAVAEAPALETPEAPTVVEPPIEAVASVVEEGPIEPVRATLEESPVVDSPLPEPTYDPGPLCHALELHAETVLKVVHAEIEAFESGIRAIMAGFEAPPINALLAAPREIVKAPAPPATQWKRARRPSIPCVRPGDPNSSSLSAGPITSALAGPCLPVDLRTLTEKTSSKSVRSKKRGKIPAWPISVLVATGLILGAGSLMQYLASRDAAVSSATQRPVQGTASNSVAAAADPHPFARFVEVTGLRVNADLNRKSQLQYLVVNHSSARLSDVVLKIAVRSTADSSGAPPLFSLTVVVPSLAAYQSKEIKSDLDAGLRSTPIPDWENLRADVQVSTKQ